MSPEFHSPHKLEYAFLSTSIDLKSFDCGDEDLNDFIKTDALGYHQKGFAKTTCVFFDKKLIGFYSLAADALTLETKEKKGKLEDNLKKYPAIKLARMAFIKEMQRQGLGGLVVEIIKGFAIDLNQKGLGVRFVTVDAYPAKVDFYKHCGFVANDGRSKTSPTISMRCDIYK